ncbi:hypothetical protein MMC13_001768 [Lambiella insularis]|nr:hypothetical protein [Lambiella insularis]
MAGKETAFTAQVDAAFCAWRPDVASSINAAVAQDATLKSLFSSISALVTDLRTRLDKAEAAAEGPATKKRKLNGNEGNENGNGLPDRSQGVLSETMEADWPSASPIETSFTVPQRKKFLLQISRKKSEGIRALNAGTGQTEFGIRWKDIEHIVCLPVPEKAQATYNFCVFPRYGDGVISPPENVPVHEPMVWTVPEVKAKDTTEKPNYRQNMIDDMKAAGGHVIEPDAAEFESQVQQAYRKGEKSYHVKAFRGSKDGFLFFLPTGIVWAFKKPLYFFSFPIVTSISYISVLQRTFNLNITTQTTLDPLNTQTQEFEFSMIDQADFAGIDAYIKRHRLQDASMAEERRAKKLNINGVKSEKDATSGDGERESELEKATREVEGKGEAGDDDGEDEEDDENFDPGSEGESEGSGTSDEEDDELAVGDRQAIDVEGKEDDDE